MVAASDKLAVDFLLSAGNKHDAPQGRLLLETIGTQKFKRDYKPLPLLMDRAYEDDLTRYIAQQLYFDPVVPPKKNRNNPWDYDKELYKKRNEVERLFRRIKEFRRVFTRYDKLDTMFGGFLQLALVFVCLR
jgi:transposase